MSPLFLSLAAGLWPTFALAPGPEPAPVLWDAPVSQAAPSQAPDLLKLDQDLRAALDAARLKRREAGPAAAAAGLEKAEAPALVLLRAGLREAAGDMAGARADFEKILASPDRSALRASALIGLKAVLRRNLAAGDKTSYQPLLNTLKEEWLNAEALDLAAAIHADPEAPAAAKDYARSQEPLLALRLGFYDRAAALWAAPGEPWEIRALAEAEFRRGRFARAAELRLGAPPGGRAGPRLKADPSAAFTILTKGGLYQAALDLAEKHPALKKDPDYGWRLGLAALAEGNWEAARGWFEPLTEGKPPRPGAWYFLGRALTGADRTAEGLKAYARAAQGPAGYYRILAEGCLARASPLIGAESPHERADSPPDALWAPLLAPGPSGRDHDSLGFHLWITERGLSGPGLDLAAADLAAAGLILVGGPGTAELNAALAEHLARRDWAGLMEVRRSRPEAFKNLTPAGRNLWPPLAATAAARTGDYRLALRLFSAVKSEARPEPAKWGHPLVYNRQVLDAWRRHGLSPALTLALIRTESAFQADVVSVSNARGLMQLLPATAGRVARALGEEAPGHLALFDPDLNIRYGAWYLAALVEGFGSEALALAGYNGGPYNIKSLISAKPGMPLDVFIETLHSEETVNYVKRVIASRHIYETAYLGRTARPDLTGPLPSPRAGLPDF